MDIKLKPETMQRIQDALCEASKEVMESTPGAEAVLIDIRAAHAREAGGGMAMAINVIGRHPAGRSPAEKTAPYTGEAEAALEALRRARAQQHPRDN